MEKDLSGLADDALDSVVLQEARDLAQKTAKVKRHPHGPTPRRFHLPSTVKIKCPISEQRALAILLRRLGMIKKDEVDERAMDRCLAVLGASFPKSLLQAIFCGSNIVKELWDSLVIVDRKTMFGLELWGIVMFAEQGLKKPPRSPLSAHRPFGQQIVVPRTEWVVGTHVQWYITYSHLALID
uniref:Uncharacterized protein n=1 Tax=Aegilops tauschii TaxID=37682 RepID=R7W2I3_AEGTA